MNRDLLFKRTKAILNPEVARVQRVMVLGAGSGGARVAEEEVRFGVGRIVLVDKPGEKLEEHNIIRHPLGYSCLGQLKTEALRKRLLDINPECQVDVLNIDLVRERPALEAAISALAPTQVLLCTDNEASKHVVNEICVKSGIPLIFAGVFDGGCGGEVGRILPGQACYACMASFLNRHSRFQEKGSETFDYSNPENDQFRSTSALNLDIAQIALVHARVSLLTMLDSSDAGACLEGNYILFGNRPVEGLFPRMLYSETWDIPALERCQVCQRGGPPEADLNSAADSILLSAVCSS